MRRIDKKIQKEMDLYMHNRSLRIERLRQWKSAQDRILTEFNNFISASQQKEFGKEYNAYANEFKDTVQIAFGTLPIAQSINGEGIDSEEGAALVYSKLPSGMVFCTVFLCSSERQKPIKPYFLLRIYKSPSKITIDCIKRDLLDLLRYQRISSTIQYASWWEQKRLQWKLSDEDAMAKVLKVSVNFLQDFITGFLPK